MDESQKTVVHMLRHGEVDNPRRVLYGRLPGYHLSEDGRLMAKAAARALAGRDVVALLSSPLERARETAEPLGEQFGLQVALDDRLIEAANFFEGKTVGVGDGSLRNPRYWVRLWNPFRPSWGEPYVEVADRVLAAAESARDSARGHETVLVSHQMPIWIARLKAEGRHLWHDPRRRQCALASITSFTYQDDALVAVSYTEPVAPKSRPGVSGA